MPKIVWLFNTEKEANKEGWDCGLIRFQLSDDDPKLGIRSQGSKGEAVRSIDAASPDSHDGKSKSQRDTARGGDVGLGRWESALNCEAE